MFKGLSDIIAAAYIIFRIPASEKTLFRAAEDNSSKEIMTQRPKLYFISSFLNLVAFAFIASMFCISASKGDANAIGSYPGALTVLSFSGSGYGSSSGSFLHVLTKALTSLQSPPRILHTPYLRLISLAHEMHACAFIPQALIEGHQDLVWVGPLLSGQLMLYHRDGLDQKINQLSEAANFRVAAVLGSSAANLLVRAGVVPILEESNEQIIQLLEAKRIDYWLAEKNSVDVSSRSQALPVPKIALASEKLIFGFACDNHVPRETLESLIKITKIFYLEYHDNWQQFLYEKY